MQELVEVFNETILISKNCSYSIGDRVISFPFSTNEIEKAQYFDERRARSLSERPTSIAPFHEASCVVDITNSDTLNAARNVMKNTGRAFRALRRPVLVLNFANPHYPGGGVAGGAQAQEEELCRMSTLYSSLSSGDAKAFYEDNRRVGGYAFTDGMLISPNVVVFRDTSGKLLMQPFTVSVLTCPAPFAKRLFADEDLRVMLKRRIECMLQVAASEGYDRLVLGAWGCGAFGNDPNMVAQAFYDALLNVRGLSHDGIAEGPGYLDMFSHITFAVLDRSAEKRNYKAFEAMTDALCLGSMELANLERFNGSFEVAKSADDLYPGRRVTVFGAISPGDIVGMKYNTQVFEVTHVGYELDNSYGHPATFEFAGTDVDTGRERNLFNRVDIDWIERRSKG